MELNAEEVKIINARRHKEKLKDAEIRVGNLTGQLLNQWCEYSNETGAGLTYSTFCNDFNFSDRVIEEYRDHSKHFYEAIKLMIKAADEHVVFIAELVANQSNLGIGK